MNEFSMASQGLKGILWGKSKTFKVFHGMNDFKAFIASG